MGVVDELVYHLEPLSTEDSVTLFLARAHEMRRELVIDADTTALVEEVCRSLDGLPLAIELAAARVRSLSIGDIARRLDDRFALLQDPSSNRPERRRALAGAIGWSYDLLFPDDQRGLWALSCFAGSASLEAVEHVLAALDVPTEAVVDTLTRLVDRSLVSVDSTEDGASALPPAGQHPGLRRRASRRCRTDRAVHRAHAALVRAERRSGARPTSGAGANPPAWPSHAPNERTSTPRSPGAGETSPSSGSASPPGSGGPGSSWATARRPPPGSAPPCTTATPVGARRSTPDRRLARGIGRQRRARRQ